MSDLPTYPAEPAYTIMQGRASGQSLGKKWLGIRRDKVVGSVVVKA